jgi:hypothetical protein
MVRVTYCGLGDEAACVRIFDALTPQVLTIRAMQARCRPLGADDGALQIAMEGLETAAYHFTRRPLYFDQVRLPREQGRQVYPGLGDRAAAVAAFETLEPYASRLGALQGHCRPFGRDWLALDIARQCLDAAAYHFTRDAGFYGARGDSAGPLRRWP